MPHPISTALVIISSLTSYSNDVQANNDNQLNIINNQSTIELNTQLSLKNATQYQQNLLVGGQPSIADLMLLEKQGYKHIINLRPADEFTEFNEQTIANELGFTYTNIPMAGAADLNFENLALFNQALNNANEKTLVHCASGNRAGALFALDAYFVKGESLEQSLVIGKSAGLTSLEEKVIEFIKNNSEER